jgi:hemolysin activation/secretion protein
VDYGVHPQVTLSGVTGHDVSLGFEFLYDSLKRRDGFLNGYRLKASYEFAETRFGADFKYHIQEVQGIYATRVGSFLNYVALLDGAIADDTLPFHKDLTLGGSSLRGYSDRQFRGDTRIMARQDLLFPAYRHRKFSIFGVVFHDLGLLYRDSVGIQSSSLRNGVGGGLRVSLAEILAPVFGLDFGYGVEDKDFHMYFALGLVDF